MLIGVQGLNANEVSLLEKTRKEVANEKDNLDKVIALMPNVAEHARAAVLSAVTEVVDRARSQLRDLLTRYLLGGYDLLKRAHHAHLHMVSRLEMLPSPMLPLINELVAVAAAGLPETGLSDDMVAAAAQAAELTQGARCILRKATCLIFIQVGLPDISVHPARAYV